MNIWSKVKRATRFVYDWVTVLAASLVGLPSLILTVLDYFGAVNFEPLVGREKALAIVTLVALVKAICASIEEVLARRQRRNGVGGCSPA